MLDAASERAERVIAEETTTTVPSSFFEKLWKGLETAPRANRALAKRAAAPRRVVQK